MNALERIREAREHWNPLAATPPFVVVNPDDLDRLLDVVKAAREAEKGTNIGPYVPPRPSQPLTRADKDYNQIVRIGEILRTALAPLEKEA